MENVADDPLKGEWQSSCRHVKSTGHLFLRGIQAKISRGKWIEAVMDAHCHPVVEIGTSLYHLGLFISAIKISCEGSNIFLFCFIVVYKRQKVLKLFCACICMNFCNFKRCMLVLVQWLIDQWVGRHLLLYGTYQDKLKSTLIRCSHLLFLNAS